MYSNLSPQSIVLSWVHPSPGWPHLLTCFQPLIYFKKLKVWAPVCQPLPITSPSAMNTVLHIQHFCWNNQFPTCYHTSALTSVGPIQVTAGTNPDPTWHLPTFTEPTSHQWSLPAITTEGSEGTSPLCCVTSMDRQAHRPQGLSTPPGCLTASLPLPPLRCVHLHAYMMRPIDLLYHGRLMTAPQFYMHLQIQI